MCISHRKFYSRWDFSYVKRVVWGLWCLKATEHRLKCARSSEANHTSIHTDDIFYLFWGLQFAKPKTNGLLQSVYETSAEAWRSIIIHCKRYRRESIRWEIFLKRYENEMLSFLLIIFQLDWITSDNHGNQEGLRWKIHFISLRCFAIPLGATESYFLLWIGLFSRTETFWYTRFIKVKLNSIAPMTS